jgi:uncharacterized protein YbbK (DUF523 family)
LISACLLGEACRYDGGSKPNERLRQWARTGDALALCPEQLGGLPTPRPAARIAGDGGEAVLAGRAEVLAESGASLSDAFRRGARETLRLARAAGCTLAVLKERSPSCGVGELKAQGKVRPGRGVTAALLAREGLTLVSDEDPQLANLLRDADETTP